MWSLLLCVILVSAGIRAQATSSEKMVVKRVGENVTLACPQLEENDDFNGIIWNKDTAPFISVGKNQHVEYTPANLAERVTVVKSGRQIIMTSLELPDSGEYVCQFYVLQKKDGSWEPRKTVYNLLVNDVPSAPGKPAAVNIQARQATVSWSPGSSNNSPILDYSLNIRECQTGTSVSEMSSLESLNITVPGLSPYTCYTATVSATNSVGRSVPSEVSDQFFTEEEALDADNSSTVVVEFNTTVQDPEIQEANITLQHGCDLLPLLEESCAFRATAKVQSCHVEVGEGLDLLWVADSGTVVSCDSQAPFEDEVLLNSAASTPSAPPLDFWPVRVSSTDIQLEWRPPPDEQLNGQLEGYIIRYGTDAQNNKHISIEDPQRTNTSLQGLKPYTWYMVSIQAKNRAGTGPEVAMEVITEEGLPLRPRITHISFQKATSFYVNWEPPTETNGHLIKYELQWIHNEDVKSRYIAGHLIPTMTAFISDLLPYTEYKVQVAAVTRGGRGEFSNQFPALTDVAAPGPPRNLNITELSPNSVHLSWEPPLVFYKTIDDYLIKGFDHRGRAIEFKVRGQVTQHTLNNLATNSRYHLKVAAITNAIFSTDKWVGDFTDTVVIGLGAYDVRDSNVIWDVSHHDISEKYEEAGIHPGIIAGVVCVVLVLLLVVAMFVGYRFYTCRKCYQAAYLYLAVPSNGHSVQQTIIHVEVPVEERQYPDIQVQDFIAYVKYMHADGDIGFSQEFDEINRNSFSDKYPCDNSNLPDNRNKNRYINIVAYDHSRVLLKTEFSRMRHSDYINANYVDGYKKQKAYIATQGPLPQTFADFWHMVWEQNTHVIVMITNLMEKGRRKCDQYWPNDGAETYGNMSVKLITVVPRAHYTVRVFSLRNMKVKKRHSMKGLAERTVYHYHYTEWPDHGVPDYTLPVLSFVQKSAAQSGPECGPIVVHCSAGVGRTGTYILIDSMIARIQDQKTINIPGFVQHIRRQRNFLVQTEDQYIFIHEVLVEFLLGNGATEVSDEQMVGHLLELEKPARGIILPSVTSRTLLERQYQMITEHEPSQADLSAAMKPVNNEKNRVGSILPVNLKRVMLTARPGIDGSDYINATYLQGYKKSAEFIVTQHPTEETMEDFWRMVWDKNSPVIVVLSPFDDKEYKEFWPPKGSSIDVDSGNFRLALKDEPVTDDDQSLVTSEFILDSIQYDYTLMTRIVCVKNWPESCSDVLHQVFDAIVDVHGYINSLECGPIIVMDRFGGVEAGTFCALWTLRDQLLSEKCADFYQVCKLYHYKRPGIVGTQENYLFLHRAMAAFCKHLHDERGSNGSSPRHHHLHNSFHQGSTRRNGTFPRATNHTNSRNTAARSSINMGRSNSGDSNNIVTTPAVEGDKVETNI